MKKNIILFCLLIFLLSGCNKGDSTNFEITNGDLERVNQISDDSTYRIDLIREDMEYFKDSYLKLHQGLKDTQIKNEFLDGYDNMVMSIDSPISKHEFS